MTKDRIIPVAFSALLCLLVLGAASIAHAQNTAGQTDVQALLRQLNSSPIVQGRDAIKSYTLLFDAYLDTSEAPLPVGQSFNLTTIHPDMDEWSRVSAWAESNPQM